MVALAAKGTTEKSVKKKKTRHLDDVRKKWSGEAFVGQAPMFFATSQKEVGDERHAPPRFPNARRCSGRAAQITTCWPRQPHDSDWPAFVLLLSMKCLTAVAVCLRARLDQSLVKLHAAATALACPTAQQLDLSQCYIQHDVHVNNSTRNT